MPEAKALLTNHTVDATCSACGDTRRVAFGGWTALMCPACGAVMRRQLENAVRGEPIGSTVCNNRLTPMTEAEQAEADARATAIMLDSTMEVARALASRRYISTENPASFGLLDFIDDNIDDDDNIKTWAVALGELAVGETYDIPVHFGHMTITRTS